MMPEEEVAALTRAWVPGPEEAGPALPPELLASMVDQFVAFSQGRMGREEDQGLRAELGSWPERYWKAFPPVVRLIITGYLKNDSTEAQFRSQLETALAMQQEGKPAPGPERTGKPPQRRNTKSAGKRAPS